MILRKIDKNYEKKLIGILKIFLMTLVMSFISTIRNYGLNGGFIMVWMTNWTITMVFVYPIVFFVIEPLLKQLSNKIFN